MSQTKNVTEVTEEIAANSKTEEPLNEEKVDEKTSGKSGLGRELEIELDHKNHFFPRT